MSHVLEHIDKHQIISLLTNIRTRLIKPDGKFFVVVPNAQSNKGFYWAYEDFTHTVLFTTGSLDFVLKSAGFKMIAFLDCNGSDGLIFPLSIAKRFLLKLYEFNFWFWNKVTSIAFHAPSPQIFSFEIKAIASHS